MKMFQKKYIKVPRIKDNLLIKKVLFTNTIQEFKFKALVFRMVFNNMEPYILNNYIIIYFLSN